MSQRLCVTNTAKVSVQNLNIMMNYFKDLQFVVFLINAHAEIQTSIPAHNTLLEAAQWLKSKMTKKIYQERDSHYDSKNGNVLAIPFINNFISSPLDKITELGSSGKDHST